MILGGKMEMKQKKFSRILAGILTVAMLTSSLSSFGVNAAEQGTADPAWGTANWIWDGNALDQNGFATTQDTWMNFRRDFRLRAVPEKAEIKIAVDSKYWLYVNGQEVVWEGAVKRGPNAEDTYYDVVDIAPYLHQGENTIAIQTWYWGVTGSHYNCSGSGGLIVSTDLVDATNNSVVETGDGRWWSMKNPANLRDNKATSGLLTEFSTVYDATQEIDWINPEYEPSRANGWSISQNIGEDNSDPGFAGDGPWNGLVERTIPQWKDYGRKSVELTEVDGYTPQTAVKPVSDLGITANTYSIDTDLKLRIENSSFFQSAKTSFLFGAASTRSYYQADINCMGYLDGSNTAVLTLNKSGNPIATVDISDILTADNYTDLINLKLEVVSESETNLYLNGQKVYSLTDNLASNQLSFGYAGALSLFGFLFIPSATIHHLTIQDTEGNLYENAFAAEEDCKDFEGAKFADGGGMQTGEFSLYSTLSYDGQKYEAQLPYNCQMVPYIVLGESTKADKSIVMYTDTYNSSSQRATYITKEGSQEFEAKNWINGDFLYFEIPDGVEVIEAGFRETGYPVEAGETTDFQGYFNSVVDANDPSMESFTGGHTWTSDEVSTDNNLYDELWKKAVRTLYVTIRDTYMDCPDRERGQYIGDAINEMEEAYYSLGTPVNALTAKAIRNICDFQFPYEYNGRTYYAMSNVRPGMIGQEINIQTLGTAHAAWNYYQFTGDDSVLSDCYQALYNYLTNFDMVAEGKYAGTVKPRTLDDLYWNNLAQWCDWGNNQDCSIETTMWWYISATSVRKIADVVGVIASDEQKAWMDERIASIEQNFESFWNEELHAYATEWNATDWYETKELEDGGHLVDDRANALAVVFGLVPQERYNAMRNVFLGTDTAPAYQNASIYMEKYVIEALYKMGYDTDAMARINSRICSMVNSSKDSTLWEGWDGSGTKNHGWSGGSMIALSRYAAGVEPTSAGYAAWHVVPQLGNFTSIDARVPSEIGNIDVKIQKENEVTSMSVVSPGGNAEFWVPLSESQCAVQTAGDAEYLGVKEAYGKSYAVFASSKAGTFAFATADEADKGILKKVIAYAQSESVQEEFSHVIEAVQLSFTAALDNALAVDANPNATPEEVESAWKTLLTEIHKLGFVAGEKETLKQLIEIAGDYEKVLDRYTPDTSEPFTHALAAARETVADGNALQGDVEEAEAALLDAMMNLRFKADKSVLEAVLAEAQQIDTALYTAESVEAFNEAKAAAENTWKNRNAEQNEADQAAALLRKAMGNLQLISSETEQPAVQGDAVVNTAGSNAKTGETAPIAAAAALIPLAGVGFVLLRKKR